MNTLWPWVKEKWKDVLTPSFVVSIIAVAASIWSVCTAQALDDTKAMVIQLAPNACFSKNGTEGQLLLSLTLTLGNPGGQSEVFLLNEGRLKIDDVPLPGPTLATAIHEPGISALNDIVDDFAPLPSQSGEEHILNKGASTAVVVEARSTAFLEPVFLLPTLEDVFSRYGNPFQPPVPADLFTGFLDYSIVTPQGVDHGELRFKIDLDAVRYYVTYGRHTGTCLAVDSDVIPSASIYGEPTAQN